MLNTRMLTLSSMLLVIAGCANLPSQGPRVEDIQQEYTSAEGNQFELVQLNDKVVNVLKRQSSASLLKKFGDYRPPADPKIGVGDGLSITIWEAGQNNMFSPGGGIGKLNGMELGGGGSTIPVQFVSRNGRITVPYVGQVSVIGRTAFEVQSVIQDALVGISVDPQVIVTFAHRASRTVTVMGEGIAGAIIPLDDREIRVLDILATAGGVKVALHDAYVQISREGDIAQVSLKEIIENPIENIQVHPGDVVTILHRPQSYTVFGAVGRNSQIEFKTPEVTLVEALARSGGLVDPLSDPRGIYVFRFERPELVDKFVKRRSAPMKEKGVPVVYQVNMKLANSYFQAQSFNVRDKDILYVSSASSTELQKFLMLIGLISQPIITGATLDNVINDD